MDGYPRPQLTRPQWLDLCGAWQFTFDDEDLGRDAHWESRSEPFDRTIAVPFPPESPASGIDDKAPHRAMWYRRTAQVPADRREGRWLLHFGAVDYAATVWVNGHHVVDHEGGHSSFSVDITHALAPGDDQVIVVRAEDDARDLTQPRGKQYWRDQPGEIWYHRTSGIWQPVWLEPVAPTYIASLKWTTDLQRGRIGVSIRLNQMPSEPARCRVTLTRNGAPFAEDEYRVDDVETVREIGFPIPNVDVERRALYWSPEYPNLIDADVVLLDEAGQPIDAVGSYLGIRSVATDGGNFVLNGRPYYLRTALAQGYWPETHLAAPSDADIQREVEYAKAFGLNGLRLHQKVEDPRYLAWCDRLGLLVWGEFAAAYTFDSRAVARLTREWMDVVERDISHPCIVAWVPFNESWGVPNLERDPRQRHYVQAIYHLTHAIDPTRPVIGNDGWENVANDIWGIHDYALEPEVIRQRYGTAEAVEASLRSVRPYFHALSFPDIPRAGQPVMLTEVGGIDYVPGESYDNAAQPRRAPDDSAFVQRFSDLMRAILSCESIQGFCYTQLTDTEHERNGFLDAHRQPKFDPEVISRVLRHPSAAIAAETTFGSAFGTILDDGA